MKAQNETKTRPNGTETVEVQTSNVLDFTATLKELRKNVDPHLVRRRGARRRERAPVEEVPLHAVGEQQPVFRRRQGRRRSN